MEFTHARDDELAGFLVGEATESRIFFSETLQPLTHFFAISLGLRLDGHRDDRLRESRWLEHDLEVFITKGIARGDVPNADQSSDIARECGLDIDSLVRLNH